MRPKDTLHDLVKARTSRLKKACGRRFSRPGSITKIADNGANSASSDATLARRALNAVAGTAQKMSRLFETGEWKLSRNDV